ncbi:MAG: transporter substrate-binding domain-containing protein, partial [Holophaga sp.]|nr:transporter substrate-binding domain-containing protein [Holophaga sp.]
MTKPPSRRVHILRLAATLLMGFLWPVLVLAADGNIIQNSATITSIRVIMDDNYPPYIFRAANGSLKGILVDQWALWEKHTGIQVRIEAMAWAKAQQRMQA